VARLAGGPVSVVKQVTEAAPRGGRRSAAGSTADGSGAGRPELRLLDARVAGLDPAGLRAVARNLTDDAAAAYATRSYRFPWALVAWHDAPVGVDVERVGHVERSFAESIATPRERTELAGVTDLDRWATDLWSSKEALAKALDDAVLYDPRRLDAPARWPGLRSGRWQAARIATLPPGHVGWLCWQ
jgi:hypothetical protein